MNILTVCEGGNVRSVGLAARLKNHGHNAVAVGTMFAFSSHYDNRRLGILLAEWAEKIVLMTEAIRKNCGIPAQFHSKIDVCEVGPDNYGNPYHPELQKLCGEWMKEQGLGE